ncbi:MAG: lysozyme [Acidobacteria bacterium]|nr:lysozyme [Acidobacteriota bacterium]
MSGTTYSENALNLARQSEGLRQVAYQDSVGVWTIGYGHTSGVTQGQTCSVDEAEAWLRSDMDAAAFAVNRLVKVPLDQGQFDALCDFVFNLGSGKLRSSTLLQKLNAGDYAGARAEFSRWVYAGGVQLGGLIARRNAEASLFSASAPQSDVQYAQNDGAFYDDEGDYA